MGLLSRLLERNIEKTLRFNFHYFGRGGVLFPVLVARNYALLELRGKVSITKPSPGCVRLGYTEVGVFDARFDRGIWQNSGEITFDGGSVFGQGSKISVGQKGCLNVGEGFRNTANGKFICHERMSLGSGTLVGWDTIVMDTDFHKIEGKPESAPVELGDNVWVGCRCMVLKGAVIPNGCVVAAGTTITKPLGVEKSLFGGINKVIRTGIEWNE